MNSNYGKSGGGNPQRGSVPLNNFDFDFGIGSSGRPKSLKDQKHQPTSSSSTFSYTQSKPATSSSWQPNKPSWTHQPAPTQLSNAPSSMVGDISGKSWNFTAPSSNTGIGIVNNKNPNLFGDLLGSALGQGKGSTNNAPLKNAAPPSTVKGSSPYSLGNLAGSLPKTSVKTGASSSSSDGFGIFTSGFSSGNNNDASRSGNVGGGPSMKTMGASGGIAGNSSGMSSNKDPFGSLVDFRTKRGGGSINSASKSSKTDVRDDAFGDFQNAPKSSIPAFPSNTFGNSNNDFLGSNTASSSNMDNFGIPTKDSASQNPPSVLNSNVDSLDMLFSSSSGSTGAAPATSGGIGSQQTLGVDDDWGMDSQFGGGNDVGGTTTELEGLPPPPSGVTASNAKSKGMDNYKQGQFADAIKWLSWAVILLKNAGNDDASAEVLSCRASCYKEVGEYKKAVADCTKILEHDGENVNVLVQRALLYESIEKYKLGAEDLRTVLKIDPGNRVARSTVHRLSKLAE